MHSYLFSSVLQRLGRVDLFVRSDSVLEHTEKQIMTTCVSAYESDLSLSKSSWPSRSGSVLAGRLTSSVPKTQLHHRSLDFYHFDIILKHSLSVRRANSTHLSVHYHEHRNGPGTHYVVGKYPTASAFTRWAICGTYPWQTPSTRRSA